MFRKFGYIFINIHLNDTFFHLLMRLSLPLFDHAESKQFPIHECPCK